MKTTINMFQTDNKPNVELGRVRTSFLMPMLLIAAAAIVLVVFAVFWMDGQSLKKEISQNEVFLSTPVNAQAQENNLSLMAQVNQFHKYNSTVAETNAYLSSFVEFNKDVYGSVNSVRPSGVNISTLSVSESVVNLQCRATSESAPAEYARAIDGLGIFASVEYSGFSEISAGSANEDGTMPKPEYSFMISCELPEPVLADITGDIEGGEAQ